MNLPKKHHIEAEICRRSFYFFLQEFWNEIIHEKPVFNWHIKYLCNELQEIAYQVKNRQLKKYDYTIINIPPGSTKTTICSVMFPAWCWTIDPTMRFITGTHSLDLSTRDAVKSRDIIRSDKYKLFFPLLRMKEDADNKREYENNYNGTRSCAAVDSGVTGKHAHIKIIDDPLSVKTAQSEIKRKSANDWIDQAIYTRDVDKSVSTNIIIMQRLHEDDCTGHILKKTGLKVNHINLPAELCNDVKPAALKDKYTDGLLDPIRLNREHLKGLMANLGSFGYAGQIMQRPFPEDGGIIKKSWFRYFRMDDLNQISNGEKIVWNFIVDGAYTSDTSNDQTAMIAYTFVNRNLYIRDAIGVWQEFPDLKNTIPNFCFNNGYTSQSKVYVEPKATGKTIVQTLKRETMINIMESESPREDKITRVRAKTPFIEAGRVHLLEGSDFIENFVYQCTSFPNSKLKDKVDCLIIAINECLNSGSGRITVEIF